MVLASASTLFREMFQTNEEEVEYQVITMKGVNYIFMKAMVDLVYNGATEVSQKEYEQFLDILRQYRLLEEDLQEKRAIFQQGIL